MFIWLMWIGFAVSVAMSVFGFAVGLDYIGLWNIGNAILFAINLRMARAI